MQKFDQHPRVPHPKDFVIWPDGSWALLEDVDTAGFRWKSDDYEVIAFDDTRRLRETGILDDPDWG